MPKDGKTAMIVGLGVATAGVILLATKAKAEPPDEEGAGVIIEILDSEGNPVSHNSPVELVEGESYQANIWVTNQSTKAGEPWEAVLEIIVGAHISSTDLIPAAATMVPFAAGQTASKAYPFTVPMDTGGETGQILVRVKDPTGVELAYALEPINIIAIEIIYGAVVVIGV